MILEARFRAATIEDCYDIARLFKIASGGVAEYTWTTILMVNLDARLAV